MRYSASQTALTVALALCVCSCSTSRTSTHEAQEFKVLSQESEQVRAESLELAGDTLTEVTMVTVQLNEAGDTVKVSTVTDRTRIRARERTKGVEVKIVEKTDTVYVAISDSLSSSNTKFSNPTKQKNSFVSSLKWICFIILGLIALIITVKVCYHR
jgi:hypothetical protein